MVDFTLTDEQKSMREMAHDFAEKEIRPVAWDYDKDGTWPGEIIEKAWELGLMNSHLPSEYGGPGLGYLDGAIIEEEIAWGCSGIGTSLSCNGLATAPISLAASEELKKEYLGRLSEAPLLASFCLTEPDAGSDVSGMKTTATRAATSGSSTAPSASSPTASTPTTTRCTPRPTRRPDIAASPASSCRVMPAWSSTSTRTRWGSGPPTRRRSPSTT